MDIRLLTVGFDDEKLYRDFKKNTIDFNEDYISDEVITIRSEIPDFPIYLAGADGGLERFKEAILTLRDHYINVDRDIHLNKRFWHSLLCLYKRDYIIQTYPQVLESKKKFDNIVLKKFDWENYIYKCVLAAEYLADGNFQSKDDEISFIEMIYNNLDVYNYIIKYNIFRNGEFVRNFLSVIEEENLSSLLKKKVKNRPDLGNDVRYGRLVIFELNKSYPVIMAPFLDKEELKKEIDKALKIYL